MKKIILFFLLCLTSLTSSAQLTRAIFNDSQVRLTDFSKDIADVLGDGRISYKASTNTFTFNNASLSNLNLKGNCNIELVGSNTIANTEYTQPALYCLGNLTFKGTGSIIMYSVNDVALSATSVTLTGDLVYRQGGNNDDHYCIINAETKYPIIIDGVQLTNNHDYVRDPEMFAIGYTPSTNTLRLRSCTQYHNITVTEGDLNVLLVNENTMTNTTGYAIEVPGTLTFKGTGSITLTGASRAINAGRVVFNDGLTYQSGSATTKSVTIGEQLEAYDLYINGVQLKSNSSYVKNAGAGSNVSYYPNEYKLVLNNSVFDIETLSYTGGADKPLSIHLAGTNVISGGNGIQSDNAINFYGTGSLHITTNGAAAMTCTANFNDGLGITSGETNSTDLMISTLDFSRDLYSHPFTVSPTTTIQFTLGNLSQNIDRYKLTDSQTKAGGTFSYDGIKDMNIENIRIDNAGSKQGFRLPTSDEMNYLLYTRVDAFILRGLATIGGVEGLLLLPDDWKQPAGIAFTPSATRGSAASYSDNVYTAAQMKTLEDAGAVFLPSGELLYLTSTVVSSEVMSLWIKTNNVEITTNSTTVGSYVRLVKDCAEKPKQALEGDLNHDGKVTIADVSILAGKVLEQ